MAQENYNLTQTGAQVQAILDKAESLPNVTQLATQISNAVGAETTRAQQAEQANAGAIEDEETRAKAAEEANANNIATNAGNIATNATAIAALRSVVEGLEVIAEGYVRVAGSSSPALSYKSYKYSEAGGFGRESVFNIFYPCLVGTALTGAGTEGKILHQLQKLDYYHDVQGNARVIDGSEGDVQIVNIEPYYRIMGKHTIGGTEYDVFLMALEPFTWQGIQSVQVAKYGWAPDYCVSHQDTDNVTRMHSVYNPAWDGSYEAPVGVVGKYIQSQDAETGVITETYDAEATLMGGAGGCHSTDINLPTGEQQAMNNNGDTTATVPWMNATAAGCENMFALMLAEGGTFDAHNATLMGSGFCGNDAATSAAQWEEGATDARNGLRVTDKNGEWKYYGLGGNVNFLTGSSSTVYAGQLINSWRNPFKMMEAHRAVMHAVASGVHEMEWFVYDGNKYKYRSITGFAGPQNGEMTCVVWKLMATQAGSAAVDPTDGTTSIAGNRVESLVSVALFHGMTTQVSPSWWTSGLVFTEDENGDYECYMERDQNELAITPVGDIATSATFGFETSYVHVGGTITSGSGFAKNYSNDALMLPDTDANKTGGTLHTYVGKHNWFTGGAAPAGKKSVRGFRRGVSANGANLSPLTMGAGHSPSAAYAYIGFGTCCRIED